MNRTRRLRPQRSRVFVGCEGRSEIAYVALLAQCIEAHRHDRHIDSVDLRGGDPLTLIERALDVTKRRERQRGEYSVRSVFLDRDRFGESPHRDGQALQLANTHGVLLVWQEPCFEAFLLRHLPGFENARPRTKGSARDALQARWPTYVKPQDTLQLSSRIAAQDVQRVRQVETWLDAFLNAVGFNG